MFSMFDPGLIDSVLALGDSGKFERKSPSRSQIFNCVRISTAKTSGGQYGLAMFFSLIE